MAATDIWDYIIIGSGAAGGVLAYNLQMAGAKVLLLEAGNHFTAKTFPRTEAAYSTQLFWGGGVEMNKDATMFFLRGKAVGGTTIVNQCDLDPFDDTAWNDWKLQSGIDWFNSRDMAPYYDTVKKRAHIHEFVPAEYNQNAHIFIEGCDKNGYSWAPLHRGQTNCRLPEGNDCIGCLGGCQLDSKQSTLVCFITEALEKGLAMKSNFQVDSLEPVQDTVRVHGLHQGAKTTLTAKNILMAGGAFGTVGVLYNSGFQKKLPKLGHGFSSHPQFMYFGVYDREVNAHKGAFQSVCSKDANFRKQGFKLENVYAPPISISMLHQTSGPAVQDFMRNYRNISCVEVAVRDEATGTIATNKKGKLIIEKHLTDQDHRRREAGRQAVLAIMGSTGARQVVEPAHYFGLHLMGGCAFGTSSANSVVDPEFRLHGFKNIYVSDSSTFPNAPGINPYLSIMALSQRLSEQLGA